MGIASFTTVCPEFLSAAFGKQGAMPKGGYEARMFTYQPAAYRMCLFFFLYQVKNLIDTILWGDGIVFVAHHVMTLAVAYGTIVHCVSHAYAPFFFGISEISTAILCLLANFDDVHGVPGLAAAFPEGKVALGALFALAFIACRVVLWSFFGYYFVTDAMLAINNTDITRDAAKPWIRTFLGSFIGLSALQVIWLGQIVLVAREELAVLF
jgi:TLC domain